MSRTAKAVLCRELNKPVVVETIKVESPKRGEIMVKIHTCGICHSDLSAINGTIPFPLPIVLGHEGAGEVVEVGEGVTEFAVGDHVVASFVYMCGKCRYCVTGRPQLCVEQGKAISSLPDGTLPASDAAGKPLNIFSGIGVMAEYATISTSNAVKIDKSLPLDRAALVGCAVTTGVGAAVNTAKVRPGTAVAVFGCGGVGLNVIQGARISGAARIFAVDTLQNKLDMAKSFGATDAVLVKQGEDPVKALKKATDGGVDYAFECVGSGPLSSIAYRALAKGGTAVVVGVARREDVTPVATMSLPFEEKVLTGSYYGSAIPRVDFPKYLGLYKSGLLKLDELITRRYTVEEAPQAFADLEAGRNARGVIVF